MTQLQQPELLVLRTAREDDALRKKVKSALTLLSEQEIRDFGVLLKKPLYQSLESDTADASKVHIEIRQITKVINTLINVKNSP